MTTTSTIKMKRSNFLKNTTILGLGVGLAPNLLFGQSKNTAYRIGIIGAGVAGLHLGKLLKAKGHDVTIMEAKNRAGGRILQDSTFYSSPIDLGAQWIHGKNELYKIVKQSNFSTYKDTKNALIKIPYKDKLSNDFPFEFYQLVRAIEKNTPLKEDISVLNFTEKINTDPDFISLIENAVTDTATSAKNLSINEIAKLTQKLKTTDYQFADTTMYGFVASNYLANLDSNIIYNSPISAIDYTNRFIVVTNKRNESYDFDKVIVTIPITELKLNKIQFTPALTSEKKEAFNRIGMDKGLKIFLKFEKRFYTHSIFNGKYAGYYIDPTRNIANSEQSLLASLIMGRKADLYYDNPEQAIKNYLLELDGYFGGQASKYFIDCFVQDWGNEEYINGVYSYTLPGGQSARTTAKKAIDNKLFFAGEAMNTKRNYGNVHGAIESAMDVIKEFR